jgi:hypothetical protein
MGEVCSMQWTFYSVNVKGRNCLGDLVIDYVGE